jgi:hypothetical protein
VNAGKRAFGDVFVWVLDRYQAGLARMFELVVGALHTYQGPSVGFELLDEVFAVHGGYYTHHYHAVNTIPTKIGVNLTRKLLIQNEPLSRFGVKLGALTF